MNADKIAGQRLPAQFRRVLYDLCAGAALVERFGAFETYIEAEGRVRSCGNKVARGDLPAFLQAVPSITHWDEKRPDGRAYRLPAAARAQCLDLLQRSMPLGDLLPEVSRPAMRVVAAEPIEDAHEVHRMRERA
ncbi:MAG: hypothetical protein Q7V53_03050 [Caldisericota bacterium]|nr:hypothetical protein [Caldisericota bacterium]